MADNLTQPLLIVNTKAQLAGQIAPSMSQSDTAAYAAAQTLNQTLVLRAGQSYSPNIGFSSLVITTTGPVQLLAAVGSNPSAINQVVNQQTTIDNAADTFTLTNNGTTSVTVKMTLVVTPSTVTKPVGVVTSINSMIGDLNIVAGPGISVTNSAQTITVNNTGVYAVNGQTGNVTINASNLPGLSTVAISGRYSDLIGAPAQYVLPVATASILGGIKVGSGLSITQDGTLSASHTDLVTSVNTMIGDVTIKATDNGAANSQSLIVNSGATTGDIVLNRLAVAGSGLVLSTANGVTTITSSGLQGAVISVDGQLPDSNGNVVVKAVDNTGTGNSLIKNSGATTGNLTFNKIAAGNNISITPDANGNLVVAGTVNAYTLPISTASVLGGVKIGANISVAADGTISVANPYVLSAATSTLLGGVKIGSNITVASDGTISVAAPYVLPVATATVLGGVKIGANVQVAGDGTISVAAPYALPIASSTLLGGIKVGSNLTIAADGTLSGGAPYALPAASTTVRGGIRVGSGLSITGDVLSSTYTLPVATVTQLGGVKQGSGVAIASDGTISVASSYVLPVATASVLGGVKIGSNVNVAGDGTISVAAPYVLPIASASSLGGIKVGANLNLDDDGTLWANPAYPVVPATATLLGGVKIGANVTVQPDGTISVAAPYALPIASATVLGGFKVGNNLTISGDGTLSATPPQYVLPAATTATLGGMIVGDNLTVDANGRVSATAYTLPTASATVLGGVKVGSGLAINAGVLSTTFTAPVTSVSGQTGAVVIKAQSASPQTGSVSLISNNGSTTGTITTHDIVAGTNVTITPDGNSNLVIAATSPVSSVNGKTGAVTIQTIDNNTATGVSVIADTGATTGTAKLLRLVAGPNITLGPDASGNLQITGATPTSPYVLPVATASVLGGVKIGNNITVTGDGTISVATPYILPVATTTVLGGVKAGSGVTIAGDGTISAAAAPVTSVNGRTGAVTVQAADLSTASGSTLIADSGATSGTIKLLRIVAGTNIALSNDTNGNLQITSTGSYTLPVATASVLGGVKIGANVSVAGDGTISVAAPYTLPIATASLLGGVKIGANISVDPSGTISVAAPTAAYTLPVATTTVLGGVKQGSGVSIAGDGTLSVTAVGGVSSVSGQTGAVVVQATNNNAATGTTLISDGGSTTGNIKLKTIVAGTNITLSADGNNNLVINGAASAVSAVSGQTGNVTILASDNNTGSGTSLIANSGSTTGNIKLLRLVAGTNVSIAADGNGNLAINSASSAVSSVSGQTGVVVVQASDNNTASGTSLIVDSGSATANIKVRRIVAGAGVAVSLDGSNNLVITASPSYYDVPMGIAGVPTASQVVGQFVAVRTINFAANFAGSAGYATAAATSSNTFTINRIRSGTTTAIGTVVYAAGGTSPSFLTTGSTTQQIIAGDILQAVAPSTADATLSNATFTLLGSAV